MYAHQRDLFLIPYVSRYFLYKVFFIKNGNEYSNCCYIYLFAWVERNKIPSRDVDQHNTPSFQPSKHNRGIAHISYLNMNFFWGHLIFIHSCFILIKWVCIQCACYSCMLNLHIYCYISKKHCTLSKAIRANTMKTSLLR